MSEQSGASCSVLSRARPSEAALSEQGQAAAQRSSTAAAPVGRVATHPNYGDDDKQYSEQTVPCRPHPKRGQESSSRVRVDRSCRPAVTTRSCPKRLRQPGLPEPEGDPEDEAQDQGVVGPVHSPGHDTYAAAGLDASANGPSRSPFWRHIGGASREGTSRLSSKIGECSHGSRCNGCSSSCLA